MVIQLVDFYLRKDTESMKKFSGDSRKLCCRAIMPNDFIGHSCAVQKADGNVPGVWETGKHYRPGETAE